MEGEDGGWRMEDGSGKGDGMRSVDTEERFNNG